jgi:hypothetical protein
MRYRSVSPSQNRHKWFSLKELSPTEEAQTCENQIRRERLKSDKTEQCFARNTAPARGWFARPACCSPPLVRDKARPNAQSFAAWQACRFSQRIASIQLGTIAAPAIRRAIAHFP